ncbi:imidazole glycerol phosphate synthase subunit HisH [Sphingomonas psychrotolerans]|uniref:Imidazole glycerol phosphate synthase subunit HisH n=1 Tax=Sphingomonas psychrotolerans TaxID=1327635 RepID=A0ABU3N5P8_9SPHN|nr:imidazole glycerol phosphate synthase subunit HisH [Sphingomonas psychrotolerans]MDT8759728.1 imidazole glycerol phosphate synthase subunit HisH [Sphingomonas psychrotolerans]
MITIVDYGVGNIASLVNMFEHVGADTRLSADPDVIARAPQLLLPGVGSFAHAMGVLRSRGLDAALRSAAADGATLLGVCLGMQLLARHSEEGDAEGLGLVAADVRRIVPSAEGVKVPNMGWREVAPVVDTWLIPRGGETERFYFAHSYHMVCDDPADVAATVDYDGVKTVAVAHGNVFGAQFHPEKSHRFGMRLLADFARLRS